MPKQGVAGRKVSIVFEEDGTVQTGPEGGARFRFYLDGLSSSRMTEINNMTDREKAAGLSHAEFYACAIVSRPNCDDGQCGRCDYCVDFYKDTPEKRPHCGKCACLGCYQFDVLKRAGLRVWPWPDP